jgi:hypothetical protein
MTTAKNTLEQLSLDPESQRLARERETAVLMHQHLIAASVEQGRAEAADGLRLAVHALCDVLGLELSANRESRILSLDCERLTNLIQRLKTERRWPDGM